jgi:hypothetical protein
LRPWKIADQTIHTSVAANMMITNTEVLASSQSTR